MLGSLTLAMIIATRTIAVVDLSSPKSPGIADAFRKAPSLRSAAMKADRTAAAVTDAESYGIICTIDDEKCLQKLMVLIRADEIVAFSTSPPPSAVAGSTGAQIAVVRLAKDGARAHVKLSSSASGTVSAAITALASPAAHFPLDAAQGPAVAEATPPTPPTPPTNTTSTTGTSTSTSTTGTSTSTTGTSTTGTTGTSTTGPATTAPPGPDTGPTIAPAFIVALGGGAVAVGCGAGAWAVSAGIAQRLNEANAGTKALDGSYDALNFAFVSLGICAGVSTAAAIGGGIVGALE